MKTIALVASLAAAATCEAADEFEFYVVTDSGGVELSVYDSDGGVISSTGLNGVPNSVASATFAPDGTYWTMSLLSGSFGTIDLETSNYTEVGNYANVTGSAGLGGGGITFSEDGSLLYLNIGRQFDDAGVGRGVIQTYTSAGEFVSEVAYGPPARSVGSGLALLDTGDFLVMDQFSAELWMIDALTGEQTLFADSGLLIGDGITDFEQVGDRIFIMTSLASVYELDLTTRQTTLVFEQPNDIGQAFGLGLRVVPTPATLAVLGSAGLLVIRRRR